MLQRPHSNRIEPSIFNSARQSGHLPSVTIGSSGFFVLFAYLTLILIHFFTQVAWYFHPQHFTCQNSWFSSLVSRQIVQTYIFFSAYTMCFTYVICRMYTLYVGILDWCYTTMYYFDYGEIEVKFKYLWIQYKIHNLKNRKFIAYVRINVFFSLDNYLLSDSTAMIITIADAINVKTIFIRILVNGKFKEKHYRLI